MSAKYTFQDVLDAFSKSEYQLLSDSSEYQNSASKLRYICPKHENYGVQTISFGHFKSGEGCKECGKEKRRLKRMIELPIDSHKELCITRGFEYVDSGRENGKIGIYFICPNHREMGVQFMTEGNMKRRKNTKCIYCTNHNLPDWFINMKLKNEFPNVEIIEGYDGRLSTRMKVLCKKHNIIHSQNLKEIFLGRGCYYCGIENYQRVLFIHWKNIKSK